MKRFSCLGTCAGLLILFSTTVASADPVTITDGSVVISGSNGLGTASVTGTRGFTVETMVTSSEGFVNAYFECRFVLCTPGLLDLRASLSDDVFFGVFTFEGHRFEGLDAASHEAVALDFAGSTFLPPVGDSAISLSAPFLVTGMVSVPFIGRAAIRGRGVTTLLLAPGRELEGVPPHWTLSELRYDFVDASEPIPEPGTLFLAGSGMLALWRARARRLSRSTT